MSKRFLMSGAVITLVVVGVILVKVFLKVSTSFSPDSQSTKTPSQSLKFTNKNKRWTGVKPAEGIMGPTAVVCVSRGRTETECQEWGLPLLVPVQLALTGDQARAFMSEFAAPLSVTNMAITNGVITASGFAGIAGLGQFEGELETADTKQYGNDWFRVTSGTVAGKTLTPAQLSEFSSQINTRLGDFASKYGMQVESISIGRETLDVTLKAPEGMFTASEAGLIIIDLGVVRPAF